MIEQKESIQILWTGGWDSTFRLLQLIIIYRKKVQPYYIIDPKRRSVEYELAAIVKIRKLLLEKYPFTEDLLLPLSKINLEEIRPNNEIEQAYQRILKKDKIGIQYEWISRFCDEFGVTDLEFCNETSLYPEDNIVKRVFGPVIKVEDDCGYHYILDKKYDSSDAYLLFKYWKLAVFENTKLEMEEMSKLEGFFDIMKETWFCHTPTRFNHPCGKCYPCTTVYKEGLSWRLPYSAKIRYHTWPVLRIMARRMHILR